MNAETYTKTGNKAAAAKLDKRVFGLKPTNHQLLKEAYLAYMSNARGNYAVTKTRGQVSGGGRKPWRQKGTGRARFGSSRNPIWTGGGVAFGPTGQENYQKRINIKAKRQALKQALSIAAAENRIKVVDSLDAVTGKVKPMLTLFAKLKLDGSILLVVEQKSELLQRSVRNLPNVKLVHVNYLGVFDILNADNIIISKKSLEMITERLS